MEKRGKGTRSVQDRPREISHQSTPISRLSDVRDGSADVAHGSGSWEACDYPWDNEHPCDVG